MIHQLDISPTPEGLRTMFLRMGIGECPRCGEYGPHKELGRKGKHPEERRCRGCRKIFYLDEIRYLAPPTGLNGTPTKLGKDGKTIFIRLPAALWRPAGGCSCDHCSRHPANTPAWDTLAVAPDQGTAWTVHMPEGF